MNRRGNFPIARKAAWALATVLLAVSCGNDIEFTYSDYHCNLTIDNGTHQDATLASAMSELSPGVFCTVRTVYKNGANFYTFDNNQGLSSEKRFTAIDIRLENHRRVGQNQGLVIGFGNVGSPVSFHAYDLQCPNCFNPNAYPVLSHELSVSQTGIATCRNCKRSYNMNTGGNIVGGDKGKQLISYRAATNGPFGILQVY